MQQQQQQQNKWQFSLFYLRITPTTHCSLLTTRYSLLATRSLSTSLNTDDRWIYGMAWYGIYGNIIQLMKVARNQQPWLMSLSCRCLIRQLQPPWRHSFHLSRFQTQRAFHRATGNTIGRDQNKNVQLTGVFSVQMKNCDPFVSGPELAIDNTPAIFRLCLELLYMD